MIYVDLKYVGMLSNRLRNFKRKTDYTWNFSCPFCGDSTKNKLKARGYIYRVTSNLFFRCHNCDHGTNLGGVIKQLDQSLYNEYVVERYKNGATQNNFNNSAPTIPIQEPDKVILRDSVLEGLKCVSDMNEDHPVVKVIRDRMIPREYWNLFYYAPRFKEFTNSVTPKFFTPIKDEHPRLIIPFFKPSGKCFAFQARAFGKEEPKYFTIKLDNTEEKIYGLDRIDYSKRIYAVEGPIDSLFLPNCIAVAGSSFDTPTIRSIISNVTVVMDNEPRNLQIVNQLGKYIKLGYNVVMYPESVTEKDINDMILNGRTQAQILDLINTSTYSGAEAELRYIKWRKC